MNINENNPMNEMDDENSIIELTGDDGNDVSFEMIGRFDYDGSDYLALIPYESEEDASEDDDLEVVFMEVCLDENDEEYYELVEEEDLLDALLEKLNKLIEEDEANEENK